MVAGSSECSIVLGTEVCSRPNRRKYLLRALLVRYPVSTLPLMEIGSTSRLTASSGFVRPREATVTIGFRVSIMVTVVNTCCVLKEASCS